MNWREKLADWLTGGRSIDRAIETTREIRRLSADLVVELRRKDDALRAIAAEAKRGKNPNATVRRLGKMAEEALG